MQSLKHIDSITKNKILQNKTIPLKVRRPNASAGIVHARLLTGSAQNSIQNIKTIVSQKSYKFGLALALVALVTAIFVPWKINLNSVEASDSIVYLNGYPTINGDYVDCDGHTDPDPAHHVTDSNDTDPGHHVGLNCPSDSLVGSADSLAPSSKASILSSFTSSAAASANLTVNVWWPVDGATVLGVQPFKAVVENMPVKDYRMYWQVDGGALNEMSDINKDGPHKEARVDVSGWNWKGSGPYTITFTAKNQSGTLLATSDSNIYIPAQVSPVPVPVTTTPPPSAPIIPSTPGNPLAGAVFYRDNNNNAQKWISSYGSSQPANATLMQKIASQPNAVWLGGWNGDVKSDATNVVSTAKSQGQMPIFVVYNIPNRDCGGYSAGGAQTVDAYKNWIRQVAAGIGNNKAVVVLEPDGIALISCLSSSELQTRYSLLQDAVSVLKSSSQAVVYIDAGHPNWNSAGETSSRLKQAGVNSADGFALNTSNFTVTQDNITYGTNISSQIGNKHFIIDTSRNGQGPASDGAWCNPSGRALGSKPTSQTGNSLVDALIWAKDPGGSDGNCNGGPSAGVFWPEYALGLAQRSSW
jgi:endoglucanase